MPAIKKKKTKVKKKVTKKVIKKTKVKKKIAKKKSSPELVIKTKSEWVKNSLANKKQYQDVAHHTIFFGFFSLVLSAARITFCIDGPPDPIIIPVKTLLISLIFL